MLIVGAGGFAKELTEIVHQKKETSSLAFYDDVNTDIVPFLFGKFPIIKNEKAVRDYFLTHGNAFTIGIGSPVLRYNLYMKFISWGGQFTSLISSKASIGSYEVEIGDGCNILDGAVFSNATVTGIGCIIYYNAVITHDCKLGNFVQIAPGVSILGGAIIEDLVFIGSNVTILPRLTIGRSAIIAAGSVITKNVPDYALMIGNPAKRAGWVSEYGEKLLFEQQDRAICNKSGVIYKLEDGKVKKA